MDKISEELFNAKKVIREFGYREITILKLVKAMDEANMIIDGCVPDEEMEEMNSNIRDSMLDMQQLLKYNAECVLNQIKDMFKIIKSGQWTKSKNYKRIMCVYILSGMDINRFANQMGVSVSTALKMVDKMNTIISAYLILQGYDLREDILYSLYRGDILSSILSDEDLPF